MNTAPVDLDPSAAVEILREIDDIFHTMKPRYIQHPTMDGRYPCWIVWLPVGGTCERKSLTEAIVEFHAQITANNEPEQP